MYCRVNKMHAVFQMHALRRRMQYVKSCIIFIYLSCIHLYTYPKLLHLFFL